MVKITELYLNLTPYWIAFHKNLLAIGSTPDDGSSKNYILVPPIKANATHNFLLLPPLSWDASVFSYASNYITFKK